MRDRDISVFKKDCGKQSIKGSDKGSYIIVGFLARCMSIEVGSLGSINFQKGYYVYVGSAMNSLSKRVKRHLAKVKKTHWHIDYLTSHLTKIKPILITIPEKLECRISRAFSVIADGKVANFGSSDCRCASHLYFFETDPFQNTNFLEIIDSYNASYGKIEGFL